MLNNDNPHAFILGLNDDHCKAFTLGLDSDNAKALILEPILQCYHRGQILQSHYQDIIIRSSLQPPSADARK